MSAAGATASDGQPARAAVPSKRGRPTRAELELRVATRAGLLAATSDLMIAKDSIDISLSEIAESTGYSPALVQYHFGNKQGLLVALVERDAATAVQQLKDLTEMDAPVLTKLRLHIGGLINAYYRAPYGNRLIHALVQNSNPDVAERISEIFLKPIARLQADLLERGAVEGLLKVVDPVHFFFMVLGAADHFFARRGTLQYVFGISEMTREMKQAYSRSVTEIVMQGIQVQSRP